MWGRRSEPDKGALAPTSVAVSEAVLRRLLGRGDGLRLVVEDLAELVTRLGESTRDTSAAAAEASSATGVVSEGTATVAAAAEEMSAAMSEVSRSAASAAEVTAEASQVVLTVRAAVERLSSSSARIDDVVKVVTGISDQTRLLALNANVEAARAGEAGRGFAVVAGEVKSLAGETGDATARIAEQLDGLVTDSAAVSEAVERIDQVMSRIDELQRAIAAAVQQQTEAIGEITRSAGSAAQAVEDLTRSMDTSARASTTAQEALGRSRARVDRLCEVVTAQSSDLQGVGSGIEQHPLQAAIVAHAAWKKRLRSAVTMGRVPEGIDPATVARDNVCAFGQWLHSGQASSLDRRRTVEVQGLHADFHAQAAAVLSAVSRGEREEAAGLLGSTDGYGGAAAALTDVLIEWLGETDS